MFIVYKITTLKENERTNGYLRERVAEFHTLEEANEYYKKLTSTETTIYKIVIE